MVLAVLYIRQRERERAAPVRIGIIAAYLLLETTVVELSEFHGKKIRLSIPTLLLVTERGRQVS